MRCPVCGTDMRLYQKNKYFEVRCEHQEPVSCDFRDDILKLSKQESLKTLDDLVGELNYLVGELKRRGFR